VIDRSLNPRANAGDRKWVPVEGDLSPWAGQTVRLTLRTEFRDNVAYDWAGWGDPSVSTRVSARGR
jgi:hypothetical protein